MGLVRGDAMVIGCGDHRRRAPPQPPRIAALEMLDVAAAWVGEAGRSDIDGLAVVLDPSTADVVWVPAALAHDDAVLAAVAAHPALRSHNAKALMRWLLGRGHHVGGLRLDTQIAAYLIDPADTRYVLADLLARYTPRPAAPDDPQASGQLDFGGDGDAAVATARQALAVSHLSSALESSLDKQGMPDLYTTIENPLVDVLAEMEHVGIAVDIAELHGLNDRLTSEVERLGAELVRVVGRPFNVNSPVQLREILYTERQLAPAKKTKTGFSTDAATLEKLRDEWPEFIDPLLQYREVEKLRSTYGEGLLAEVAADGRIHATFNQTVARTGRLSAATSPTCTTSRCAATKAARSARCSSRRRAARCWSPTTTRSSCAASLISPATPV